MRIHFLFVLILAVVTGCREPDPIKIGYVGSLAGRAADIGISSRNAVQMAIDEANAAGGINGRLIQLVVRDDRGNAEGGAAAVKELISEGTAAILGPNISTVAKGMLPLVNNSKLVTISPTVASLYFVGKDDYFFRLHPHTGQFAAAFARYAQETGFKTVAVALDKRNQVFTESLLTEFRKALSANQGTVAAAIPFDGTIAGTYSQVAERLLAARADAILYIANGVDTANLSQQVRLRNQSIPMMAASWAATKGLIELGGQAVEGLVMAINFDQNDKTDRLVRFHSSFVERFQSEPSFASIFAYDGVLVLLEALRKWDGVSDLKEVVDSLQPVAGLQKPIVFDAFGDSTRRAILNSVQDGEWIPKQGSAATVDINALN